jgi:hypothetical protein
MLKGRIKKKLGHKKTPELTNKTLDEVIRLE